MLPKCVSHPCRRSHRLAHGVPEGSKRSHPTNTQGCIEGRDGGQTRCFPEGTSLCQTTLTLSLRRRRNDGGRARKLEVWEWRGGRRTTERAVPSPTSELSEMIEHTGTQRE